MDLVEHLGGFAQERDPLVVIAEERAGAAELQRSRGDVDDIAGGFQRPQRRDEYVMRFRDPPLVDTQLSEVGVRDRSSCEITALGRGLRREVVGRVYPFRLEKRHRAQVPECRGHTQLVAETLVQLERADCVPCLVGPSELEQARVENGHRSGERPLLAESLGVDHYVSTQLRGLAKSALPEPHQRFPRN